MGKLFGTDGVRGIANKELTPELALNIGKAGAYVLTKENKHAPKIIVGMDTRISGDMLEAALTAGMCSLGATVYIAGVIPTPGIAYLVRKYNLDAGVVISASHNPMQDNGIKFFNSDGYKLPDCLELEIENIIFNELDSLPRPTNAEVGRKIICDNALNDYIDFLHSTVEGTSFKGMKIALDCANGATHSAAKTIFEKMGANVTVIHNEPDGTNINLNCGSTHMESLVETVKKNNLDIGIAFDGDGDRCLFVDENGKIVEGDEIMSICVNYLKEKGKLKNNTLVATVMSNLGLFVMGEKLGINIEKTGVGDRYVLERMLEKDFVFGGEQSGHIIFLEHNTTGDGILTGLKVVSILAESGKTLSEANCYMEVLPQALVNAKVDNDKKYLYLENSEINKEIEILESKFAGEGRVLIRPSGTEPLVRVMIEGKDKAVIEKEARKLADLIESLLSN